MVRIYFGTVPGGISREAQPVTGESLELRQNRKITTQGPHLLSGPPLERLCSLLCIPSPTLATIKDGLAKLIESLEVK